MKQKTLIAFLSILLLVLSINFVCAQTKEPDEEVVQSVREQIQKQVEERVANLLEENKKRGWSGVILKSDNTGFEIENSFANSTREVLIGPDTTIISETRQSLDIEDLVVGKKILAMGYLNGENILLGKRILVIEEDDSQRNRFPAFGTLSDKSLNEKIITVVSEKGKDDIHQLTINSKSIIETLDKEKVVYDDLVSGSKVALVYENDEDEKIVLSMKILKENNQSEPSPSPSEKE